MHGYKTEKSKVKQPDCNASKQLKLNVNFATANTKSYVVSMCVVPVLVPNKLSNCIVNCSQATFRQKKLLGALGLHGYKTSITVKTLHDEVIKSSEVLDGIDIAQASNEREEKLWVHLPSTYT